MKIHDLLAKRFTISFEFFPPKTEAGERSLEQAVKALAPMHPDFVSVTYGAGGTTREKTRDLVCRMERESGLNVMAHLTCVQHSKEQIVELLENYRQNGIDDILALRGDAPAGTVIDRCKEALPYAKDLVKLIRERFGNHFSIGGAAFPERHPESPNMEWELEHFKSKVDTGLNFAITQLFFETEHYIRYRDAAAAHGIHIPIIPGIMPITNFKQIRRFAELSRATIPQSLVDRLEPHQDNEEELAKLGIEYAVSQCEALIRAGAPGLHFYTLNTSTATQRIYSALKKSLPRPSGQ